MPWICCGRLFALQRNTVSCCGSLTGSDRSITALMMLNIAVLAPMPRASVRTAIVANPGLLASNRMPYRASCQSVERNSRGCMPALLSAKQCFQAIGFPQRLSSKLLISRSLNPHVQQLLPDGVRHWDDLFENERFGIP